MSWHSSMSVYLGGFHFHVGSIRDKQAGHLHTAVQGPEKRQVTCSGDAFAEESSAVECIGV